MPVDLEQITKAFDSFEEDDFVTAKEIIKKEINTAKNAFIADKLGLAQEEDEG